MGYWYSISAKTATIIHVMFLPCTCPMALSAYILDFSSQTLSLTKIIKIHKLTSTNTPPIANNRACARDHIKMLSLWYMGYKHTIMYFHAAIYHLSSATSHSYIIMYNDTDCHYDFLQQVISE